MKRRGQRNAWSQQSLACKRGKRRLERARSGGIQSLARGFLWGLLGIYEIGNRGKFSGNK